MLNQHNAEIGEERSARKQPLADEDVSELLGQTDEVLVAKGKKVRLLPSSTADNDDLKGPTGKYRAPIIRHGRTLLVGWNEEALSELIR